MEGGGVNSGRNAPLSIVGPGTFAGAAPARANGRFPASNQILFSPSVSPSDLSFVVARTTYAVLPSRDNGATWSYLCEDALGLPSSAFQDPALVVTASGALVAGLATPTAGLDVSTDFGCTWSCVAGSLGGWFAARFLRVSPWLAVGAIAVFLPVAMATACTV